MFERLLKISIPLVIIIPGLFNTKNLNLRLQYAPNSWILVQWINNKKIKPKISQKGSRTHTIRLLLFTLHKRNWTIILVLKNTSSKLEFLNPFVALTVAVELSLSRVVIKVVNEDAFKLDYHLMWTRECGIRRSPAPGPVAVLRVLSNQPAGPIAAPLADELATKQHTAKQL